MKTRLRLSAPLLPVLALAALVMQILDPSRIWTIFLVGLGGLLGIAYAWARSLQRGLSLRREMRYGWAQVGDTLEERFSLHNTGWFPATWVELEDRSTLPGYDASRATGVDPGSTNQWLTEGICARRGVYFLGGTALTTGDPFGIFSVHIEDPARATLMVMPPVVPLPPLEITPGGYSGDGRPLPHAPELTVNAHSVREYTPGDSLRLIHWATTARQGKPFVRLFDGAPASDWWILLDLHAGSQLGTGPDSTDEHAIILAASLSHQGLRARRSVGLAVNGQALGWLPPRPGENQKWDILRALALAERGPTPLADLLQRIRPALGRTASLVIITPNMQTDWLDALLPLRWRGIQTTALLLEPRSFGGAASPAALTAALERMGIAHHLIPRGLLDHADTLPGARRWEWRVTPRGRAIPIHTPGDPTWRRLTP